MSRQPSLPSLAPRRPRQVGWKRGLWSLTAVILLTAVGLVLILWWEDLPLREVEVSLNARDFPQALRLVNGYLREHSGRTRALDLKARALVGLQRWQEVTRVYDRIGTDTAEGQRAWSQALLHQQRWTAALPLLQHLHELAPCDPDILHELAACHGQLGDFDEAIECAARLTRVAGHETRGGLLLGMLYNNHGDYRFATAAWKAILERDPDAQGLQVSAAEFFLAFGRVLLRDGHPDEARAALERSVMLHPGAAAQVALAETWEQSGDVDLAVTYWQAAVRSDPPNREAREGLARIALERHAAGDAVQWLAPIARGDEVQSSTAYLLQRAHRMRGSRDEADAWAETTEKLRMQERRTRLMDDVLREKPRSDWAQAIRAYRYARQGNAAQAAALIDALQRAAPRAFFEQPFVRELLLAVHGNGPLPSLDSVPIKQF